MALISAPRTLVGGGALLLEESPSIRCAQPSPDWQQKALVRPRLARQHGSIGKIHGRFNLLVLAASSCFCQRAVCYRASAIRPGQRIASLGVTKPHVGQMLLRLVIASP